MGLWRHLLCDVVTKGLNESSLMGGIPLEGKLFSDKVKQRVQYVKLEKSWMKWW